MRSGWAGIYDAGSNRAVPPRSADKGDSKSLPLWRDAAAR